MYYPVAWLDESTNTTYQNGYYDEQGNHYDNLILKNNEKYENVPMHCEYCETTQVRDLTDDNETMTCPHCGANMVIDAILDERTDIPSYDQTVSYNSTGTVFQKGRWRPFIIVAIVIGHVCSFLRSLKIRKQYSKSADRYGTADFPADFHDPDI